MLNEKGQTLVEFAFVILLLLVLVVGITEFSRAWNNTTLLTNGARAGARYAASVGHSDFYVYEVKQYTRRQIVGQPGINPSNLMVNMSAFTSSFPNATSITLTEGVNPPLIPGNRVGVIVRYKFTGLGGSIVPVISGDKYFLRQ